jgi:hypothetical protein
VVEAYVVAAGRLEQGEGADDVGLDERARVVEGVVVVRLRREVHRRPVVGEQLVDQGGVRDVADDELDPVLGELLERLAARGVGQLVEHRHRQVGVVDDVVHEVGADEPGATGHEKVSHGRPA